MDKAGIIHATIGRKSMGADKLRENYETFMAALMKAKPSTSKGNYLRTITVSSTMGPGVKMEIVTVEKE